VVNPLLPEVLEILQQHLQTVVMAHLLPQAKAITAATEPEVLLFIREAVAVRLQLVETEAHLPLVMVVLEPHRLFQDRLLLMLEVAVDQWTPLVLERVALEAVETAAMAQVTQV
jgi:hypothetical protein